MVDLDKNILLIQINVNGLNTAIKRQRSEKKMIRFLQFFKKTFKGKDTERWKIKGQRKRYNTQILNKKGHTSILISDKINVKETIITEEKEGHFTQLKI